MKTQAAQLSAQEKLDGVLTRKGNSDRRDEIVVEIQRKAEQIETLKDERSKAIALALNQAPKVRELHRQIKDFTIVLDDEGYRKLNLKPGESLAISPEALVLRFDHNAAIKEQLGRLQKLQQELSREKARAQIEIEAAMKAQFKEQNKQIAKIEEDLKKPRAKLKEADADCTRLAKDLPVPVPEPITQDQARLKITINQAALEHRLNELKVEAVSDIGAHNLYNNTLNFSNAQIATLKDPSQAILLPLLENFGIYFPVLKATVHLELTRELGKLLKSHKAADIPLSNEELVRVRALETFYESIEPLEEQYNKVTKAINANKYFMQTAEQMSPTMRMDNDNSNKLKRNLINAHTLITEFTPFATAMQSAFSGLSPNTLPPSIVKSVNQHREAITKLLGLLQLQLDLVLAKNMKIDEVMKEVRTALYTIPAMLTLSEEATLIFQSRIYTIAEISFLQQQQEKIKRLITESIGLYTQQPPVEKLKAFVEGFYNEYLFAQQQYLEAAQSVKLSTFTGQTEYKALRQQADATALPETYPSLATLKLELEAHGLCPENSRLSQLSNSLHRIVNIFEMVHLVQTY